MLRPTVVRAAAFTVGLMILGCNDSNSESRIAAPGAQARSQSQGSGGGPSSLGTPPAPSSSSSILLDLRQSLQRATTIDAAFALFGQSEHTAVRGKKNTSGWSFAPNYDGQGTHALRADWDGSKVDQSIEIAQFFSAPLPKEIYVQWKSRLGRHQSDNDANGGVDQYQLFPRSMACKRALFHHANFQHRIDYTLSRSVPEETKLEMGDADYSRFGAAAVWNPNQAVGGAPFTTTVHVRAASSNTTADGVFQLWIDGALLIDQHDVPASADPIYAWSFPTTCVQVPVAQSEYFWDIFVWKP